MAYKVLVSFFDYPENDATFSKIVALVATKHHLLGAKTVCIYIREFCLLILVFSSSASIKKENFFLELVVGDAT